MNYERTHWTGTDKEQEEELARLFRAIRVARPHLGHENAERIRYLLVSGRTAQEEVNYRRGLVRDATARSLGKTREEYEMFLEG